MAEVTFPRGFQEQMIDSIRDSVEAGESTTDKGRLFLKWCLANVFELSEQEIDDCIVDAPGDQGIDAYCPSDALDQKLMVVQSKYGSSHSLDAILRFKLDVKNLKEQDLRLSRMIWCH